MNRTASWGLLAAVLLASSCGSGEESGAAARETIEIAATDFAFGPAEIEVDESGVYSFRLVNRGESTHALEIEGQGVEEATAEIGPGESAEVRVELQAGRYELYCPVGNHREMGMEGTLTVAGAPPGGGTTTTDGGEDKDNLDY